MLNNFIYAQTKDLFLEALGAGNVLDEAIVFIEDTKEIWNHGHYFGQDSQRFKELEDDLSDFIEQWNNSPASTISSSDITNWNNKQDKLTSGTNIKTINGQSVLGSGNITISAFANHGYTTDITEPGLYKVIEESYINLGSITSHPNSIYTIYIKPISDPLEINYPTNFKWCNGEPNFASIGDDGKVVELNILVLDDGSSSHLNTCLCTWAVFE